MNGKRTDIWKTLRADATGEITELRKTALTDNIEGHIVDTCDTVDAGWETGIRPPNKPWIIVESYDGQAAAKEGHQKWVAEIKNGRKEFPDNQP